MVMAIARHPCRGRRPARDTAQVRAGRRAGCTGPDAGGDAVACRRLPRSVRCRPRRRRGLRGHPRPHGLRGHSRLRHQPVRRWPAWPGRAGDQQHRHPPQLADRRPRTPQSRPDQPRRRFSHQVAQRKSGATDQRRGVHGRHRRRARHRRTTDPFHGHLLPARRPQHLAVRHPCRAHRRAGAGSAGRRSRFPLARGLCARHVPGRTGRCPRHRNRLGHHGDSACTATCLAGLPRRIHPRWWVP